MPFLTVYGRLPKKAIVVSSLLSVRTGQAGENNDSGRRAREKWLLPLTRHIPKPVISVGGVMLIERHVRKLAQTGYSEVIINVSYLADVIKQKVGYGERHGIRIIYSDEGNCPLNTGGGVKNALDKLGHSPFLLVSADVFTDWNFSTINLSQNVSGHLFLVKRSGEAREKWLPERCAESISAHVGVLRSIR